ncbi:MAG: hypothetical protein V2A70_05675 [Candidatus Omnitrophota bacterium]
MIKRKCLVWGCLFLVFSSVSAIKAIAAQKLQATQDADGRRYFFDQVSWGGDIRAGAKDDIKTWILKYRGRFLLLNEIDQMCSRIRQRLNKDMAAHAGASCEIHKGILIIKAAR